MKFCSSTHERIISAKNPASGCIQIKHKHSYFAEICSAFISSVRCDVICDGCCKHQHRVVGYLLRQQGRVRSCFTFICIHIATNGHNAVRRFILTNIRQA